jgi:hypothetical protein
LLLLLLLLLFLLLLLLFSRFGSFLALVHRIPTVSSAVWYCHYAATMLYDAVTMLKLCCVMLSLFYSRAIKKPCGTVILLSECFPIICETATAFCDALQRRTYKRSELGSCCSPSRRLLLFHGHADCLLMGHSPYKEET